MTPFYNPLYHQVIPAKSHAFLTSIFLVLFFSSMIYSQQPCGTQPWTEEYRRFKVENFRKFPGLRNNVMNKIPLKAHIVRLDDGTGGMTFEQLAKAISFANYYYYVADMEFFICEIEYIDNTDYYDFNTEEPDNDTEDDLVLLSTESTEAINAYFMNSMMLESGSVCGYARFPFDAPSSNRTLMDKACAAASDNGTFVHELGHYFSLPHTHAGTENGPADPDAENVDRVGPNANCMTAGDLICDTNADPSAYDDGGADPCVYEDDSMDIHGVIYMPPIENIMSYWADFCGGNFSAEQYLMISMGLAERLTHTSYSLTCTPLAVNAPSDLSVVDLCGEISLTWTDNANNELGYLIERSITSPNSGFQAIPGAVTGPDETNFIDDTAEPGMTYWYRMKSVNGDPDVYSNVFEIEVGQIYCIPFAPWGCILPIGGNPPREHFSNVTFADLSNSSGCEEDGYVCYRNMNATVSKGSSYTMSVEITDYHTSDSVYAYFDWNKDGDFEDPDEFTFITLQSIGMFSSEIEIPAEANLGTTMFRLRVMYTAFGDSAVCAPHPIYEMEDYGLIVEAALPVSLLTFRGEHNNGEVYLTWTTTREINNEGFEIHHSPDGVTFTQIGYTPAFSGTANDIRQYAFNHDSPLNGRNYYKLRQTDHDGTSEDSPVIEVRLNYQGHNLSLYPNPANSKVFIDGLDPDLGGEIILRDIQGKLVLETTVTPGSGVRSISTLGLAPGWYQVLIKQASTTIPLSFVIVH